MAQVVETQVQVRAADGSLIEPSEKRARVAVFEKEIVGQLPAPKAKIEITGGVGEVTGWHLDPVGKKTRSGYTLTATIRLKDVEFNVLPPDPTLFDESGEDENGDGDGD